MNKVFVILGPTSSGKTSLALDLCQKFNGEIISADSRQIYKFMDIGTGKFPKASEKVKRENGVWNLDGINIWGYDLVTPNDFFSAFEYAKFALSKISERQKDHKTPFLVGGTGFYIDMVTGRIGPANIPPDFELRKQLSELRLEELQEKLKVVSPVEFSKIDKNNPVRLIRALEKNLRSEGTVEKLNYLSGTKYIFIGLTAPREVLYKKADDWLENIWLNGLITEVSSLLDSPYKDSPKLRGLVYKMAAAYIKGELSEEEAKARTKFDLHAYIRRQQTYFKKMPDINWLDITQDNKLQKVYNILDG